MDLVSTFQSLGIALGLGLLVGLQRESVAKELGGVRTFPLVTIMGVVCGALAQSFGGWIVAAGLLAVTAMIIIGNVARLKAGPSGPGITTEIALLLMFGVGAYLVVGYRAVAVAIGGGCAVLLQFKSQLHGITAKLGAGDLTAIMQLALISMVILPVLPDRTYGPYAVFNPRQVWLMVVLIVGLSLTGYIIYKFVGERAGIVLGGILGGVISSTATTVSYARRTVAMPGASRPAAVVIMIASTIMFARLLIEIGAVAPAFLPIASAPILALAGLMAALSLSLWLWRRDGPNSMPLQENPSQLKSALMFGAIYALALFAVAAAKQHIGDKGLYVVAGIAGLTNVDAITLSTAQLVQASRLEAQHGWRLILLAALSNMVFKGAAVAVLGHRQLSKVVLALYGIAIMAGVLLLALWPS
jgi:uncharacterized membrane protein (DUF4010 family)